MPDWTQPLAHLVQDKHGTKLRTLACARAYALKRPDGVAARQHWQHAAKLLLEAADGGDVEAATDQVTLALLLDGTLDLKASLPTP